MAKATDIRPASGGHAAGERQRSEAETAEIREALVARLTELQAEVDLLRSGGARAEVIGPDEQAQDVLGMNFLDLSVWRPAVEAGHQQASRVAGVAAAVWNGDPGYVISTGS